MHLKTSKIVQKRVHSKERARNGSLTDFNYNFLISYKILDMLEYIDNILDILDFLLFQRNKNRAKRAPTVFEIL